MKVVILAGGLGTRLSEETATRPKPMVEIGGRPILWHLMNLYASGGFDDFVVALGYKQEVVKDYFRSLHATNNDISIDFSTGDTVVRERSKLSWKVDLVDTGADTMTGGRIKRLREIVGNHTFMCTYGDGLASIDVAAVLAFHRRQGRAATITAVRPPARFGTLDITGDRVVRFVEKPQASEDGSTAVSSSSSPRFSIVSTATRRSSNTNRSSRSRQTNSSPSSSTTASGNRWTRCAIAGCSKNCGPQATHRGCCPRRRRPSDGNLERRRED